MSQPNFIWLSTTRIARVTPVAPTQHIPRIAEGVKLSSSVYLRFSGLGYIAGTILNDSVPVENANCYLHEAISGALARTTKTGVGGTYLFAGLNKAFEYRVVVLDPLLVYDPVSATGITPA